MFLHHLQTFLTVLIGATIIMLAGLLVGELIMNWIGLM